MRTRLGQQVLSVASTCKLQTALAGDQRDPFQDQVSGDGGPGAFTLQSIGLEITKSFPLRVECHSGLYRRDPVVPGTQGDLRTRPEWHSMPRGA